jgi:hypothetical protein
MQKKRETIVLWATSIAVFFGTLALNRGNRDNVPKPAPSTPQTRTLTQIAQQLAKPYSPAAVKAPETKSTLPSAQPAIAMTEVKIELTDPTFPKGTVLKMRVPTALARWVRDLPPGTPRQYTVKWNRPEISEQEKNERATVEDYPVVAGYTSPVITPDQKDYKNFPEDLNRNIALHSLYTYLSSEEIVTVRVGIPQTAAGKSDKFSTFAETKCRYTGDIRPPQTTADMFYLNDDAAFSCFTWKTVPPEAQRPDAAGASARTSPEP